MANVTLKKTNRLNNKQIEKLCLKIKLKLACGHVGIKCQDTKKKTRNEVTQKIESTKIKQK